MIERDAVERIISVMASDGVAKAVYVAQRDIEELTVRWATVSGPRADDAWRAIDALRAFLRAAAPAPAPESPTASPE